MNVIKKTNYLDAGTVVVVKSITDWDYVGIVIHPADLPECITVKGYQSTVDNLPIVRTATRYYRLHPKEDIEVLYEPISTQEFKPTETQLYPIEHKSDY